MWMRNTDELECVHVEGIKKETVLDGFIYPFKAICSVLGNGKILNTINGKFLASTEITTKKQHEKPA
jgi:hypothetical protein